MPASAAPRAEERRNTSSSQKSSARGVVDLKAGPISAGSSQDIHRGQPHSLEAEKALLSSILLDPIDVFNECIEKLGNAPDVFYIPAHQSIYEVILTLQDGTGTPVEFVTLAEELKRRQIYDQIGGAPALADLLGFVPSAANAGYYIGVVYEKMMARRLISTCTEFTRRAYEQIEDTKNLLDEAESKIFALRDENSVTSIMTMPKLTMQAIEAIEKLCANKSDVTGLATGFTDLDQMTSGLQPGEMAVIAARPSMGKTALAMNIAEHAAIDLGKPVVVFSLEMSSRQLVQRMLCSRARVNFRSIRNGMLSNSDFNRITQAASELQTAPMFIDETPGISILELRSKSRRLKSRHDIALIVIDYLQLLKSTSRRAQDNRQVEVAEISAGIKALSKELDVPILVLAQLNRQPEGRGGRPRLSDLRESGAIEQDADLVSLLYRPEYYADDDDDKREEEAGKAELIIAKQRNGPVGDVPLTFLKDFTRFESRAKEKWEE